MTLTLWTRVTVSALAVLLLGVAFGLMIANSSYPQPPQQAPLVTGDGTTVVAAGDIACEPSRASSALFCQQSQTAALVSSLNPDVVLALGDLQYQRGELEDFMASYDKSWGAFKLVTKPVPGNHEYLTPGAAGYFDYFGALAGERGKGYYSFDAGDWHVIALNSEIDVSAQSQQRQWLQADLAAHKTACTLAYWHKPRFTTGIHADDVAFRGVWQDLYDAGAEVVINGHSHIYERFLPLNPAGEVDVGRGIVQFVSGMGGAGYQSMNAASPTLATRQNHAFGVLKLNLQEGKLLYEFVAVPGGATFKDQGTVQCRE